MCRGAFAIKPPFVNISRLPEKNVLAHVFRDRNLHPSDVAKREGLARGGIGARPGVFLKNVQLARSLVPGVWRARDDYYC
jgi:hypothetical protein